MAYADTIRTTDYTREELANLIDGNRFVGEAVLSAGTAPNYTVTLTPAPSAYFQGMAFDMICHSSTTSTGVHTLNVNGLGAKNLKIVTRGSSRRDVNPYELSARQVYRVVYESALDSFQIMNPTHTSFVSFTPTWSVPTGTLTIVSQDNTYAIIGDLIFVTYEMRAGLAGSSAAYISATLPFDRVASYEYLPFSVYASSVTGMVGYSAISSSATISTTSFYRSDAVADWPLDGNFYVRAAGFYKANI